MSLFKRAAAADQRNKEENITAERKGTQEIEIDSTMILMDYINGEGYICNRPNCPRAITLDEALERKLACSVHRTVAKLSARARREVADKPPKRRKTKSRGTIVRVHFQTVRALLIDNG